MNLAALLAATSARRAAVIAKLEWAGASGSERQLRDVAAMLDIGEESLDLAYLDRWVTGLGLQGAWSRAQALRSAG